MRHSIVQAKERKFSICIPHSSSIFFLFFTFSGEKRWVSLFNADLALSVSTTAISTLVSIVMLPLNLFIYSILAFDDNVADDINYASLFGSITVVILAIGLGLYVSISEDSHHFNSYVNKVSEIQVYIYVYGIYLYLYP